MRYCTGIMCVLYSSVLRKIKIPNINKFHVVLSAKRNLEKNFDLVLCSDSSRTYSPRNRSNVRFDGNSVQCFIYNFALERLRDFFFFLRSIPCIMYRIYKIKLGLRRYRLGVTNVRKTSNRIQFYAYPYVACA